MIIHVMGTTGSGKTYIGNLFKNKINVIDLDDWTEEFDKKTIKTKKTFMSFIDEKINKINKIKNVLLVGYLDVFVQGKIIIYDIDTPHKFFIKIPLKQLFNQYNSRIVKIICKNKKEILNMVEKNNYDMLPVFKTMDELKTIYDRDVENYESLGYRILSQNKIIWHIDNIIKN